MTDNALLPLIVLFPLLGACCSGALALAWAGREEGPPEWLVSLISGYIAPLSAFGIALFACLQVAQGPLAVQHASYAWFQVGTFRVGVDFFLDHLTVVMVMVVTFVGSLIHLYSVGYMAKDRGFARYFAYLNLFTFSMLVLVLAQNLPLLFLGWEGVGVCSYFLIGFWFENGNYVLAANKAFIVNRIGDFAFLIGMFVIFRVMADHGIPTLDIPTLQAHTAFFTTATITAACFLLLGGAVGKSAQIPLYVWLPDAMAGPTPVSALIHAATMVTAGVYMIARLHFLYALAPTASLAIAWLGILTALFAATIAIAQNDIKKVLAYSTISQLGYMFAAVGVGAYAAGIFHLFTHAFFKALLFLAAGAVIHGMAGEQDLWKMGGLWKAMPVTAWTMLAGVLAISGIPPFSGFFSKDEILWSAYAHGQIAIWAIGVLTAGLTAFYMMRMFVLAFWGDHRVTPEGPLHEVHTTHSEQEHRHAHDASWVMAIPMILLAIGAFAVGWLGIPRAMGGGAWFGQWLSVVFGHGPAAIQAQGLSALELGFTGLTLAVALLGIGSAWWLYARKDLVADPLSLGAASLWEVLSHKYWVDELYDRLLVKPFLAVSEWVLWRGVDLGVLDRAVDGVPAFYWNAAGVARLVQSGRVRLYALAMLAGTLGIFLYLLTLKGF